MANQNRSLFLGFGVTDKPCFESSDRSNITRCYSQDSIGYVDWQEAFKTKTAKSKKYFWENFEAEDYQISLRTLELSTYWNNYFYNYAYKNLFYQRAICGQFCDRNIVGLMLKYYLLAGDPWIRWKWVNMNIYSLNH